MGIENIVKEYLRNNLSINIDREDYDGLNTKIKVKLILDGEEIDSDFVFISERE